MGASAEGAMSDVFFTASDHFQDLGLPQETDGNPFPLAGVAGLLKT